jgi:hypothetical protein
MAKERLSKIQKEILDVLDTNDYEPYWVDNYHVVKQSVARRLNVGGDVNIQGLKCFRIAKNSFNVSFSRSIRNLQKKGLIKNIYACNLPKENVHDVKTNVSEYECPKENDDTVRSHSHYENKSGQRCVYYTLEGNRGIVSKKSKIVRLERLGAKLTP